MFRYAQSAAALAVLAIPACFSPVSGIYEFTEGETTTDCPEVEDTGSVEDTGAEDNTELVTVNDDKTEMTIGEGEFKYTCTMDGRDFDCPMDPFVYDMTTYGYDAVSTTTFDIGGSWTGNESFDLALAVAMTCTGADCETLSIPSCSSESTGTAELVEASE